MRGTHNDLVITTSYDEATDTEVPLLHFPIQICKATDDQAEVRFDVAAPSGAERQQVYKDTATDEEIPAEEAKKPLRGVRTAEGFIEIDPEQIEAIEEETKLIDMRVERATPFDEVPFDRATGLYFLQVPAKSGAHKVYNLIYNALLPQKKGKKADKERLALRVKFSVRKLQKLGVVWADPARECLMLSVLTYGANLRKPDEAILAHKAAQVEQAQIDKARAVLVALKEPLDPATKEPLEVGDWDTPTDELVTRKRELMEQAAAGEKIEVKPTKKAETVQSDKVSDLLDASLAGVG